MNVRIFLKTIMETTTVKFGNDDADESTQRPAASRRLPFLAHGRRTAIRAAPSASS
jgi:hypothetical protein